MTSYTAPIDDLKRLKAEQASLIRHLNIVGITALTLYLAFGQTSINPFFRIGFILIGISVVCGLTVSVVTRHGEFYNVLSDDIKQIKFHLKNKSITPDKKHYLEIRLKSSKKFLALTEPKLVRIERLMTKLHINVNRLVGAQEILILFGISLFVIGLIFSDSMIERIIDWLFK